MISFEDFFLTHDLLFCSIVSVVCAKSRQKIQNVECYQLSKYVKIVRRLHIYIYRGAIVLKQAHIDIL